MRYQSRSSTEPEPNAMARWLAIGIALLVIGEAALVIARACGCGK
ncbi:MAG TPA: hypothetical protein VFW00_07220 [Rhodocyclaceae bacterium]|nr:hypothetical protein [Rhodocyclaceae bacterium]